MDAILKAYISDLKQILGDDCIKVVIYGSYVRGDYGVDSDIDIAIFTHSPSEFFYLLINRISEITFEYDVKYDIILSPIFQNIDNFNRMLKAVPYYQSIEREGITIE